jgi:hypothetical protein
VSGSGGELDPQGLEALARAYVAWAETMRGISRESKKAKTMRLRRFVAWCAERDVTRAVDVTGSLLERYPSDRCSTGARNKGSRCGGRPRTYTSSKSAASSGG